MALDPARASFRFYAELNDHLPPGQRYRTVEQDFFVFAYVKDMIEGFGVPHTEVDLILCNGRSSDFSRLVQNGARVAVYPVFESLHTRAHCSRLRRVQECIRCRRVYWQRLALSADARVDRRIGGGLLGTMTEPRG